MSNLTFIILSVIVGLILNFVFGDYLKKHKTISKSVQYIGYGFIGIGVILTVVGYIIGK